MNTVKTRKVGNSITITIPKELEIQSGVEFVAYKGVDGAIVFAPKIKNPLNELTPFIMEDDFSEVLILDSEIK